MKIQHIAILFVIIMLSALFRFTGVNWDENAHLHPDERFLTMVTTDITWPTHPLQYFDTRTSPLNPHNAGHTFFVYGTYPLYLTKTAAQIISRHTYDGITLTGRVLSGIADMCTVFVVFLIARYLSKNSGAGLLAAFFYGIAVLPIQQSHFFSVDTYAVLFITITLWQTVREKSGIIAGIAAALAVSAKVSAGLMLIPLFLAFAIRLLRQKDKNTRMRTVFSFLLFGIGFLITVRIAYPYLFDGLILNTHVLENWKQLQSFNSTDAAFPPALQWVNVPAWQPALDMLFFGLGLPLGILALISIAYYVLRMKEYKNAVLLSWIFLVLGYQSLQFAKAMRYFYSIYPALAVLIGMYLYRIRLNRFFVVFLLCVSLLWPVSFLTIYTRPHTRVTATDWIYTNIPRESTIAWESWDDPLPFARNNHTPSIYTSFAMPVFDEEHIQKWEHFNTILTDAEYLILSSNRGYGAIERSKKRYPKTYQYYQLLLNGSLGFDQVAQFTSRPALPIGNAHACVAPFGFSYGSVIRPYSPCTTQGVHIVDDYTDETFTVYDHPVVTIFKKTRSVDYSDIFGI